MFKFKAIRLDNGEEVTGSYVHQTRCYGDEVDRHWVLEDGYMDIGDLHIDIGCYVHEVDKDTVQLIK